MTAADVCQECGRTRAAHSTTLWRAHNPHRWNTNPATAIKAGTCRYCPARIRWARTTNGNPIPLDADPTDDGNVVLDETGLEAGVLGPLDAELARQEGIDLFMPHHATCPNYPPKDTTS